MSNPDIPDEDMATSWRGGDPWDDICKEVRRQAEQVAEEERLRRSIRVPHTEDGTAVVDPAGLWEVLASGSRLRLRYTDGRVRTLEFPSATAMSEGYETIKRAMLTGGDDDG